jgi:hypothetical protein
MSIKTRTPCRAQMGRDLGSPHLIEHDAAEASLDSQGPLVL